MQLRKKRVFITAALLGALLAAFLLIFSGCKTFRMCEKLEPIGEGQYETMVGEFDCSQVSLNLTYSDGTKTELTLTEDMLSPSEYLKFFHPGEQTVRVTYENVSCEISVFVKRYSINGITLDQPPVTYDGKPHTVAVQGDLPSGATVEYPLGNSFINAGEHKVVAAITCDGYETLILATTLVIEKAEFDCSAIEFSDKTVVYNGMPQMITASRIPSGVSVNYEYFTADGKSQIHEAVNAGTYLVKMPIYVQDVLNYRAVEEPLTATLTIEKAVYDMSGVTMNDRVVVYDGEEKLIEPTGKLPSGVTVGSYTVTRLLTDPTPLTSAPVTGKAVNAGSYQITVNFEADTVNHEPIPSQKAVLRIEKATVDCSRLTLAPYYCDFDGNEHSVAVEGTLPEDISVVYYYNNIEAESVKTAGSYNVRAVLMMKKAGASNYDITPRTLETTMIIREITREIPFTADNIKINESDPEKPYYADGLPEGVIATVTVSKEGNPVTSVEYGVEYDYSVSFEYEDEVWKQSAHISPASGLLFLRKKIVLDVDSLEFGQTTFVYNGEVQTALLNCTFPEGCEDAVSYLGNKRIDVGESEMRAVFDTDKYIVTDRNGTVYSEITSSIRIEKREADLSSATFPDLEVEYDGKPHNLKVEGLPEWVTAKFSHTDLVEGGVYTVTVTLEYDEDNNKLVGELNETAVLTIKPKEVTVSGLTFPVVSYQYDKSEHKVKLEGTIPDWVDEVRYENNASTDVCNLTAKATLIYNEKNYKIVSGDAEYTASFKITPATFSLDGIDFDKQTYIYDKNNKDGYAFVIDTSTLPEGVSVVSDMDETYNHKGIGIWTGVMKFTGKNYVEQTRTVTLEVLASADTVVKRSGSINVGGNPLKYVKFEIQSDAYLLPKYGIQMMYISSIKDESEKEWADINTPDENHRSCDCLDPESDYTLVIHVVYDVNHKYDVTVKYNHEDGSLVTVPETT